MSLKLKALSAAPAAVPLYVEDVFSTYLYTGNNSTQTITNGIDLAGEGGLVWIKGRNSAQNNVVFSTETPTTTLVTNLTNGNLGDPSLYSFDGYTSSGFLFDGNWSGSNDSSTTYASWTFRKAENFFDVVTYTGNGSARTISHNLGSVPGCIIVKRTDTTGAWQVYHRSNTAAPETDYLVLNTTAATADDAGRWNDTLPTSTVFSLGTDATVNANTGTYVAYLFAHNAGGFGDDGSEDVISCGSYTGAYPSNVPVTLGWEPQWLLIKNVSQSSNWCLVDTMRGIPVGVSSATPTLAADSAAAENGVLGSADVADLTPTGFIIRSGLTAANVSGNTHIYIAIRRGPMRVPESGTEVFKSLIYTGNETNRSITGVGFAPDLVIGKPKNDVNPHAFYDRMRGATKSLQSTNTNAEATYSDSVTGFDSMDGISVGVDLTEYSFNWDGKSILNTYFRRAPGFFDVVAYTGNGVAGRTVPHNLGVAPEMMIVKSRSDTRAWRVYTATVGNTGSLRLNADASADSGVTGYWNNTSPSDTSFTLGTDNDTNASGQTYIAYLFATLPGISKVGTYTGNGSSQTINCGFTSGARFVLIKRTDSTGDWLVGDTARGIVAGNDPYLELNTTAAEDTDEDWLDADSSGFIVNETSTANANVSSATYIYLAIA